MVYEFILPVGDYSCDGHQKCTQFRVQSNKSIKDVRLAHSYIPERTGVRLTELCNHLGDDIVSESVIKILQDAGCKTVDKLLHDDVGYHMMSEDFSQTPHELMAEIWVHLLMMTDASLVLELVPEVELPELLECGNPMCCEPVGYGLL